MDQYFNRSEVSNSDLGQLKDFLNPSNVFADKYNAYRIGTLIDAIITEPEKLNLYTRKLEDYTYSADEIELAKDMKKVYLKDDLCKMLHNLSEFQNVFTKRIELDYEGYVYNLNMRCKFDLWMPKLNHGADIKSTACTTQKQFEDACLHFDYDRQRAVYMLLSGAQKDMIIGISKKNLKIFKVPVTRDSEFFKSGIEKLWNDGFKWWTFFGENKAAVCLTH